MYHKLNPRYEILYIIYLYNTLFRGQTRPSKQCKSLIDVLILTGWFLVVLGQYRVVLVDTFCYWVITGWYWMVLGATGSVWCSTGLVLDGTG